MTKEEQKEYKKEWRLKNKEHIKEYSKKWYLKNKDKKNAYDKKYMKKYFKEKYYTDLQFRFKLIERTKKYLTKKYNIDINYKILHNLRSRVCSALKGNPKLSTTMKIVGCSIIQLKQHLESQFAEGMSWSNYGFYGWHIDHIKPCASFDLTNPEEQKKCFHYTNLQPLWGIDNIKKGKKELRENKII